MSTKSVVPVSEYTTALKKWWPAILGATIVGALLGSLFFRLQSNSYEAEARVEVRPLVVAGDDPNLDITRQVNTTNERVIASSQRITERALALLNAAETAGTSDLDDPEVEAAAVLIQIPTEEVEKAQEQIEVTVPSESQILVFRSSAGQAERAQNLANASAHAYLDFRQSAGLASTEESRAQLVAREAELIAELDAIAVELGAASADEVEVRSLTYRELSKTQELEAIGAELADLTLTAEARAQLVAREAELIAELGEISVALDDASADEVQIRSLSYRELSKSQELQGIGAKLANLNAIGIDPGVVLDDASLPESVSGLPAPIGFVTGALLGLLAGVAGAYWLDRRDDRFRDTDAELASMGVAILGDVPVGGGLFRRESEAGIAVANSEAGEAYRRVQGSLLFNLDRADKSVVLVAGTNNPQSSTTVAANLAVAAAQAGRRTLLVGADLRRPSLHERFDLSNDVGLSDVLSGRAHLAGSLQTVDDIKNLRVLSSGSPVDQPARLLQGEGLGRLVSAARAEYDLVVFEAPPVMQVADAVDLARMCEGVVLVIEPSRATRRGVNESIEQLRRVGADVVGTVVAESAPD